MDGSSVDLNWYEEGSMTWKVQDGSKTNPSAKNDHVAVLLAVGTGRFQRQT